MSRQDLLERYRSLPLPSTTDEPWRFTDLKGFDPDTFVSNGHVGGQTPAGAAGSMLDLDVAAVATVSEEGIEIERAPEGVTFAPLPEDFDRLYSLVGWDEKFAAHNAAMWKHGLLEVAKGAEGARSKVVCDALILDEDSRTDTYPYISIDENNVDIGHEATVSKIGEEQLFYLMSRGLSEAEAAAMIVSGFVEPITKELPLEYAVEMNRLIQLQMEGSVG